MLQDFRKPGNHDRIPTADPKRPMPTFGSAGASHTVLPELAKHLQESDQPHRCPPENAFFHIVDPPQLLPCNREASPHVALESIPGAWPQRGYRASNEDDENSIVLSVTSPSTSDWPVQQEDHALAVAALVKDNRLPLAVPEPEVAAIKQGNVKQFKTYVLLPLILLLGITAFVVALLVTSPPGAGQRSHQGLASLTSSPSQAPTSINDYVLELLPGDTVRAIDEPDSPQVTGLRMAVGTRSHPTWSF